MPSTSPKKKKAATTATTATATDVKEEVTSKNQNTDSSKNNKTNNAPTKQMKRYNNNNRNNTKKKWLLIFSILVRTFQIGFLLFLCYDYNDFGAMALRPRGLYLGNQTEWKDDIIPPSFACATAAAAAAITTNATTTTTTTVASSLKCHQPSPLTLERFDDYRLYISYFISHYHNILNDEYSLLTPVLGATRGQKEDKTFIRTLNESIAYMEDPESVCASLQLHTLLSPVRTIVHARKDKKNKNNIKKKPCHFIDYGVRVYYKTTTIEYYNDSTTDTSNNNKAGVNVTFDNDLFFRDGNLALFTKIFHHMYISLLCAGAAVCMYLMVDWYRSVSSFFSRPATASEKDAEKQKEKNKNKAHGKLRRVCAFLVLRCRDIAVLVQTCVSFVLVLLVVITMRLLYFVPFEYVSSSSFERVAAAPPTPSSCDSQSSSSCSSSMYFPFAPHRSLGKDGFDSESAFSFDTWDAEMIATGGAIVLFWLSFAMEHFTVNGFFPFCFRCCCGCCCCCCCRPLKNNNDNDNDSSSSDEEEEEEDEHDNEKKRK